MKIKKIAVATFLPAAVTGIGLSSLAAAEAATGHAGGHLLAQSAGQHKHQRAADGKARTWVSVRPGDTLSRIAAAHRMSWQAIYATPPNFQHLASPDLLTVGQRLRIPSQSEAAGSRIRGQVRCDAAAGARRPCRSRPRRSRPQCRPRAVSPRPGLARPGPARLRPARFRLLRAARRRRLPGRRRSAERRPSSSASRCTRAATTRPPHRPGLYGILPSTWSSLGYSGTAGQASVAQQNAAFSKLYAQQGTQPWAPYDGC